MSIQKEPFEVVCPDGVPLRGVLLIPDSPKAVVQFNAGTAAKKEFYLPFLEYLVDDGFLCCLWDYRGNGDSAPPSLKGCDHEFLDYGLYDIPTVKSFLRKKFPGLPFLFIGHSAGGQMIGFTQDLFDVKGLIGLAVSTGYMRYMPLGYRMLSYFFFKMFSPVSNAVFGYVAAKRFGIMEDLPKNVVKQWHAWCRRPTYFFDKRFFGQSVPLGNFKKYQFPVQVYWANDDPISNKRSVPAYWNNVSSSEEIRLKKLTPRELGLGKIEHFGYFSRKLKENLWKEVRDTLNDFIVR